MPYGVASAQGSSIDHRMLDQMVLVHYSQIGLGQKCHKLDYHILEMALKPLIKRVLRISRLSPDKHDVRRFCKSLVNLSGQRHTPNFGSPPTDLVLYSSGLSIGK